MERKQVLTLPEKNRVLSVQAQNDTIMLWTMLEEIEAMRILDYNIYIVGTGWKIEPEFNNRDHIGTVKLSGFVWHIFKDKEGF